MIKNNSLIMFAVLLGLLHHFIGHMLIQGYLINNLGWGQEFLNGLPALFLGSTFAVTLYIVFIAWFFGRRFKRGGNLLEVSFK